MGNESLYNENYYKFCCGELPYDDPAWLPFFEGIADRIVKEINPKTVLDVGCAMGHLVTALRKRGVEAYGIDVSEYAISKVSEDSKAYCRVFSALDGLPEDFPEKFDLVTTIEVIEHLREEDCEHFIKNICSYTDQIIFSSTPDDFWERTHYNVQQIEYWAKRFAKFGFIRNINYSCKFISKQAVCFNRADKTLIHIIEDYERYIRQETKVLDDKQNELEQTNLNLEEFKNQNISLQNEFAKTSEECDSLKNQYNITALKFEQLTQEYDTLNNQHIITESKLEQLTEELLREKEELYHLLEQNKQLNEQVSAKQGEIYFLCDQVRERDIKLDEICNSRCYRVIKKYYRLRQIIIPQGSKRFIFAKILFKLPGYVRKGYPVKMIQYVFRNGLKRTGRKIKEIVLKTPQIPEGMLIATECKKIGASHIVPVHQQSVDIIICVHNAYEDVKRCVESVYEFTTYPYNIIIVDDGSDEVTRDYLKDIAESCPNIKLIRNELGKGYTFAANIGLKASDAEYCVLLNSDTIVTKNWLDKMIDCAQSDECVGIVGPLSNTASWQSIPNVFDDDGDWCHNRLPDGVTVEQFGKMVEEYSEPLYFNVPLLNGFCLMIHRNVINRIGYLDEETFGPGFGEEDDYNLRATKAGFKLAVADNTYIFHAQSKSYSDKRRKVLCEKSGKKLRQKHGDTVLDSSVHLVHKSRIFAGIRARTKSMLEREQMIQQARKKWEGKRILFLLPIAEAGGGGNVIIQEANIMKKMGIDVCLYNHRLLKPFFEAAYPDLTIPVIYGDELEDFRNYAEDFDAICSTLFNTVKFCNIQNTNTKMVYYIQDYEPYFFKKNSVEYKEAKKSYTAVPDMIRVTKTKWNAQEVEKHHNVKCNIIGPSVNIDIFRPRKHFPDADCIKIAAMVRPSSPRRAPEETISILREIESKYKSKVKILIFGADVENDPNDREFFANANTDFKFEMLGKLNPMQMAELLADCEIFVDFSTFQAMGLTAMEAMASGCAVIVPEAGGAGTFARHNENALIVDTSSHDECVSALDTLICNDELREKLSYTGISDMCSLSPEHSAYRFLTAVFESEDE